MKVLWNGEALDEFSQPGELDKETLSPYLFVLCIKSLFQLINLVVQQKTRKPILLSRHGSLISHMVFVDDLILFADASLEQATLIQNVLNLFCRSSGQKLSMEKSRMFFLQKCWC